MTKKVVPPTLGADSFSCPHCGALAHQTWLSLFATHFEKDQKPIMPDSQMVDNIKKSTDIDGATKKKWLEYFERVKAKEIFLDGNFERYRIPAVANLFISRCFSCKALSVWHADSILYPAHRFEVEPNDDMPPDVNADFFEAAAIVEASPRGAAALLRLAIQKLMKHLGQTGKDLNADIGALVNKGLDPTIQKALDAVRVIGNNAAHPGTIDLKDDKAMAISLFGLVNFIVESQITAPKQIDAIYGTLPPAAVAAIDKRDGAKG
jgi:Domain of unknown function (DUF4145)